MKIMDFLIMKITKRCKQIFLYAKKAWIIKMIMKNHDFALTHILSWFREANKQFKNSRICNLNKVFCLFFFFKDLIVSQFASSLLVSIHDFSIFFYYHQISLNVVLMSTTKTMLNLLFNHQNVQHLDCIEFLCSIGFVMLTDQKSFDYL